MKKPESIWHEINERQREYLKAIYHTDQEKEQYERSKWSRGDRPLPADQWRWMLYATTAAGDTELKERIRLAGMVDPGTGSTFDALAARSLILVRSEHSRIESAVHVRLTTLGRKVARVGLGEKAPKKQPTGTLQEWHWRALALLYKQYATGEPKYIDDLSTRIGWNTWLRLREYKAGHLMKESEHYLDKSGYNITPFGIEFYEREYARYRDLYPGVEAIEPIGKIT